MYRSFSSNHHPPVEEMEEVWSNLCKISEQLLIGVGAVGEGLLCFLIGVGAVGEGLLCFLFLIHISSQWIYAISHVHLAGQPSVVHPSIYLVWQ